MTTTIKVASFMPEQKGFSGFNNFRQLAQWAVKTGWCREKNCEKIYRLLLHYLHTLIYFG